MVANTSYAEYCATCRAYNFRPIELELFNNWKQHNAARSGKPAVPN